MFMCAGASVCMHMCKLGCEGKVNMASPSSGGIYLAFLMTDSLPSFEFPSR